MIDEQRIRAARRLCLFAHYHQDGIVAPHVVHYLNALRQAGFTTVVLSTAALDDEGCAALRATGVEVILRENHGMDFGGWIEACMRFFPIQAELLLLANDSVYGPLSDLSAFIDQLLSHDADFYGAVESREIAPHLQSWFVLLRPRAYRSPGFATLMCAPMPNMANKLALVTRYEVGLTRTLVDAGLRYHAAFSLSEREGVALRYPYNPAHLLWREMIAAGVPFLKIELVRLNLMRVTNIGEWRAVVADHAPVLAAMIEDDMAVRGTQPRPSFWAASSLQRIYWPEVRGLILSDYHRSPDGRGMAGWLRVTAIRTILSGSLLRRLYARFLTTRRLQPTGRKR